MYEDDSDPFLTQYTDNYNILFLETEKAPKVSVIQSFSFPQVIVDDLGQVDGLAYEWVTRKIYFTDYIYERLEVANADGSYRKTLFYTNMYNPRGIAVDPKSG